MKIVHNTTVITSAGGTVRTLHNHSLVFDAGQIGELAPASDFQQRIAAGEYEEVITGERHVVIPGLVNTHHHLFQALTRCLPAAQNDRLFAWLVKLYPRWRHLDYEAVNVAAKVSIAELLLHGCTTTNDHFYMVPPDGDVKMEAVLEAGDELGIRLHLCRGSMTLGASRGGLPPDDCVENDSDVLADCQRVLDKYHDTSEYALRRIDLAPCSPFNCTRELLRDTAIMARERGGVLLHTHLAETLDEERFCRQRYGCRPVQFLADLGFLGPDVYLAHGVYLNDDEITLLASTGTGVSHNPSSNMRLGSGIAPIRKLLDRGVRVGLGVDGSGSNDGGNLLGEARQALLVARVLQGIEAGTEALRHEDTECADKGTKGRRDGEPGAMLRAMPSRRHGHPLNDAEPLFPVADAFRLATLGGASCLNRPVLGHVNPGAAADFAMFRTDDIALAGAFVQDPLAALMLCATPRAERVYVAGREVVCAGRIVALDENRLAEQMNRIVATRFGG
ncbi:MAG: amidohydrolase family protein [Phycisphaerae bacterium]